MNKLDRSSRSPRLSVPAVLGLVVVGACTTPESNDASVSDAAVMDAIDERGPTCIPGPGPDGSIELRGPDGGTAAYGRFYPDGASALWLPDGMVVGTFETDPDGWLRMGGPCGRLA